MVRKVSSCDVSESYVPTRGRRVFFVVVLFLQIRAEIWIKLFLVALGPRTPSPWTYLEPTMLTILKRSTTPWGALNVDSGAHLSVLCGTNGTLPSYLHFLTRVSGVAIGAFPTLKNTKYENQSN